MKQLIILSLFLISCNHLERGTVLKKEYEPEHSYTVLIPIRIGRVTTFIPHRVIDNEDFVLTIEGEYKGELIHEHVYVTEQCYNSLKNGDTWNKTKDCSFQDENNLKIRE